MLALGDKFGPAKIEEASDQQLGFPAVMVSTESEVRSILEYIEIPF